MDSPGRALCGLACRSFSRFSHDEANGEVAGAGTSGLGEAPSLVVAVRFTPEELARLDARAEARHVTRSSLIREAALA
ncbi:CopG family transcriptional regulator [Mobiluncus curtisii]|uniref:Ribbon-helix-helix protein, CopG family n=1 Tax=Mobiluncus curtisii TaxID=2051 RepID=A0A7Y0YCK8_9ACTO|nr:CopG family transcriptional regulator [Mobiluncus curtisii]MCU9987657.1 ribbon-helix-helix protein, CopG family [Mobiluncus curtisii]MCV0000661.1 ribbon-helix-helix protein, CopG family [Mobiluncus curtisii]NMW48486.1 ribbon-helix-helix protein, CopG family [Mobiluncus curtisii]NMW87581.1 ribbon-helix-helix protein, CopG family [Mobiluncus curtisii]NMX13242.1 ribbon-helix-helix protein, CopG family [Mobiluncus curtisii]